MIGSVTQLEILDRIWARSAGEYVFLPTISRGNFNSGQAHKLPVSELFNQPEDTDVYFTPVAYDEPMRVTENISEPGVLYADLDDGYDRHQLANFPPSVLWETSPNNLQAVWFLTDTVLPSTHTNLNRRLSEHLRADHSSWIPTKLLRIPGSINYKRGGAHGRLLKVREALAYDPEDLMEILPELRRSISDPVTVPAVPTPEEWRALVEEVWPVLTVRAKWLMKQTRVEDRSLHLVQIASEMATIRIDPEVIFGTLTRLVTNKFADRPDVLWNSIVLPISEKAIKNFQS